MKQEKSAGCIVYYYDKKPFFLVLKNTLKNTYWGFPKGKIEDNEKPEETAIRETKEEVNLDVSLIPGFDYLQKWFYKKDDELIKKESVFFLTEIDKKDKDKVKINFENEDFKFLSLDSALELMKIKNNKEMLIEAERFIKEYNKQKKLF